MASRWTWAERETEEDQAEAEEQKRQRDELEARLRQLNEEYAKCRNTVRRLGPERIRNGFVWLFLRKPKDEEP